MSTLDRIARTPLDGARRVLRTPLAVAELANILLTTDDAVIGATPKEVVWTHRCTTLYRYRSSQRRHAIPVLLVFALINRPDIFDLRPGGSLVEYLLDEGFDVFLLDWGVPNEEDAETGLDDYVCDDLDWGIRETLRAAAADEVTLVGWCIGATLCAMYCGLDRGGERPAVRNIALLTMPIDGRGSTYAAWVGGPDFDPRAGWRTLARAARRGDRLGEQDAQARQQLLHHVPQARRGRVRRHRAPGGLPDDGQVGRRQPAVPRSRLGAVDRDDVPRAATSSRAARACAGSAWTSI